MVVIAITTMASHLINELIATIAVTGSNTTISHESGCRDLNPNLTTPNGGRYQITPHPVRVFTVLRKTDQRCLVLRVSTPEFL